MIRNVEEHKDWFGVEAIGRVLLPAVRGFLTCRKMTLLCLASSHRGLQFPEDRPADVALEAAANLALGAAFSAAAGDVFASGFVVAHPRADDDVECSVELAVS
tara:strand:- start:14 stop:322 length:309 start_codon:yes stop_codon:yes gene_type:complete